VQGVVRALWLFVLPALFAGFALKFLVPAAGDGFAGWVSSAGRSYSVFVFAALFLAFSWLGHHWRFHLPGGRYASSLPAHLIPTERDPARLRAWAQVVDAYEGLSRPVEIQRAILAGNLEGAQASVATARAASSKQARSPRAAAMTVLGLVATVAAVFAVRARLVESYRVTSASMLPTLEPADVIAANKLAYASDNATLPARGDVVVFASASVGLPPGAARAYPEMLVKRVIGLPGDRIEIEEGTPVINGWRVPSCDAGLYLYVLPDGAGDTVQGRAHVEFLAGRAYLVVHQFRSPGMKEPYVVKPGEVFVLGDNRANSLDSRSWNEGRGGGLPLEGVRGRAQWFLVGTRRSGDADLSRFLRPVDTMQSRLRLEGVDVSDLQKGIERCMKDAPKDTTPPPPGTERVEAAGS
jgi:signal peptidase I